MSGLLATLLPGIDAILGVRDSVGAVIQPVFFVTRSWFSDVACTVPAAETQNGYAKDVEVQMFPSPQIVDLKKDGKLREGGVTEQGDIVLRNVSRNSFSQANLDGSSSVANVEKLYRVGGKIYQVIDVTESYVTWKITLKELTNQVRY